jgi:hypothetical protein
MTVRISLIAACLLLSAAVLFAQPLNLTPGKAANTPQLEDDAGETRSAPKSKRLREGTELQNRLGRFRVSGDSATFTTKEGIELGGLPNLNLQRVVQMLGTVEEPENVWWSVSGVITEFGSRNYVLISRAVYKAASQPPPVPERIAIE